MSDLNLVIYGLAGLFASILSGIAGAGGGFIMTPLAIFLGLNPAQAVATGKFNGLSVTVGALFGMRSIHGRISKARVIPVMVLAFVVGLSVPFVIKGLDHELYRIILGIVLLLMIPVMVYKKVGIKPTQPSPVQRAGGGVLLAGALALQGIFSGGLGTLVNVVLMGMMGMTATEANLTKRWSQLILNITIVLGVLTSGLIVWNAVVVGVITTAIGGYIGGRIAVKRGDTFIMRVLIVLTVISALALIFGM